MIGELWLAMLGMADAQWQSDVYTPGDVHFVTDTAQRSMEHSLELQHLPLPALNALLPLQRSALLCLGGRVKRRGSKT